MPLCALQTLIDNGMSADKVRDICEDLLASGSTDDERGLVLLAYLREQGNNTHPEEVEEARYGDNTFEVGRCEYRVLTDDEADDAALEYIEESLWAFNAEFLAGQTNLPVEVFTALADQCEGANDAILAIIKQTCGLNDFVADAVSADGRGHFLGQYDGDEGEIRIGGTDYYIYRNN